MAGRRRPDAPTPRPLSAGEGALRNRIRTDQQAVLVAYPARGDLADPGAARGEQPMSYLSPAAREIIAGRHADPFRYLGVGTEIAEGVGVTAGNDLARGGGKIAHWLFTPRCSRIRKVASSGICDQDGLLVSSYSIS